MKILLVQVTLICAAVTQYVRWEKGPQEDAMAPPAGNAPAGLSLASSLAFTPTASPAAAMPAWIQSRIARYNAWACSDGSVHMQSRSDDAAPDCAPYGSTATVPP